MFVEKGFRKRIIGRKAKLSTKKLIFGKNLEGSCTPHARHLGSATGE